MTSPTLKRPPELTVLSKMLLDFVIELKIVKKTNHHEKKRTGNLRKWFLTLPKRVFGPIDDQTDQLLTKSCVPSGLSWIAELKTQVCDAILNTPCLG